MSISTSDFDGVTSTIANGDAAAGPLVEPTSWGYRIRARIANRALLRVGAQAARFVGTLLLIAAASLLVMPDGAGSGGMKLGALVMFAVFGFFLFRAGQTAAHPELHVDVVAQELRIGYRELRGKFRPGATLAFADVSSVYLLRCKERGRPARLFLRIAGGDDAIEVASGPEQQLEKLRERLARDLAREPRQPVRPVVTPRKVSVG